MKKQILIVEDDIYIGNLLEELLKDKYSTIRAFSGTEALFQFRSNAVDLVLLDLMLPGLRGEEVLSKINGHAKVIVLSAKNSKEDKVGNLLSGANDYITKPFDNEELLARIEVQLRGQGGSPAAFSSGEFYVDDKNRTVFVNDNKLKLTRAEYDILLFLMRNPNHVFSKSQIFERIWNTEAIGSEESIKVHVSNLRTKIAVYTDKKYIETVWGIGFRFVIG